MKVILPQPIYNCHFSIIFSHQSLSKRFHFQKPCFAHIQIVSYITSPSFSENIFVPTLKLSFLLKVKIYKDPATIRVLTFDKFAGTNSLFADMRAGT
jgi:hypothetical protein